MKRTINITANITFEVNTILDVTPEEITKSLDQAQIDTLDLLNMCDLDSGDIMIDLHNLKVVK